MFSYDPIFTKGYSAKIGKEDDDEKVQRNYFDLDGTLLNTVYESGG